MFTAYCRKSIKTTYVAPLNRGAFFFPNHPAHLTHLFSGGNRSLVRGGTLQPCECTNGIVHNMRMDTDIIVLDSEYVQSR
jgi:hypothetical protein